MSPVWYSESGLPIFSHPLTAKEQQECDRLVGDPCAPPISFPSTRSGTTRLRRSGGSTPSPKKSKPGNSRKRNSTS